MKVVDISVLVTNYNHAQFLGECLQAILSQSVAAKEIIVIDDASTDNSISIIKEFQKKYPSVILLQSPKNQGPARAMNQAIQAATGEYVVLAAADDKLLPGFFEKAIQAFETYPNAGICCSEPTFFDATNPLKSWRVPISFEKNPAFFSATSISKQLLLSPLWFPTHASLYRRSLLLQYSGLNDGLKHICDWYLNCKIALTHGIIYVPESFGAFRLSTQSYGSRWNRSYRKKMEVYRVLFSLISQETSQYQTAFRQAGALGLISADVLAYVFFRPSLWGYLPFSLFRKTANFFRKFMLRVQANR